MANTVTNITAVLQMNNTKFKKGLTGSQKALSAFKSQVRQVGGMIGGAFAVGAIVNFTKEAIQLSSQAEGIRVAFQKLNNPTLLDDLKAATRGTVTELDLMRQAVRAENFKVPLDQLATFFQFATDRAIQTGESVDYLVDSIINGIGRKSTLVMDNLGISAAELQEEIKLVGDFGQAAANIIERSMTKAGVVLDTTATRLAAARAEWGNFKVMVGEGATKTFGFFTQMMMARFNPAMYAAARAAEDLNEMLYEQQTLLRATLEMDARFGKMNQLKAAMREEAARLKQERYDNYKKNKGYTPSVADPGFNTSKDLGIMGFEVGPTPSSIAKWASLGDSMDRLGQTTEEWGDELEEIFEDDETDALVKGYEAWAVAMRKAREQSKELKIEMKDMEHLAQVLAQSFVQLGITIINSMKDAEQSTADLIQSLMNSIGQVLMQTGNAYAMIAGGVLQMGSAIWDASETTSAPASGGGNIYDSNVQFIIQGPDLVGVLNNQNMVRKAIT